VKPKRFLTSAAMLCMALALFAAPTAMAGETPTSDAYGGTAGQVGAGDGNALEPTAETGTDEGSQEAIAANSGSSSAEEDGVLPFTGLQILFIGLVAVALLGGGLVLRRTAHPDRLG